MKKAWWKSKTVWLNALVLTFGELERRLDLVQSVAPAEVYAGIAIALPVANIFLRGITSVPLGRRDEELIR